MKKYYTRVCNFYYGKKSAKLIKQKKTLPLKGNKEISFDQIEIITRKSKKIIINPLEVIIVNNKNKKRKLIAINEVSLFRQSKQTASLKVRTSKNIIIKKLIGDGILISTPAGSTAYNMSVNGPILSLNSGKLAITPISPFRPRRWKGKIVTDRLKIIIKNLNPNKRPISAVADNIEVRNAKQIVVKTNKKIKFNLLYDQNRSLQKKIKIEELRRETS